MLTPDQRSRLTLLVGASALGFYESDRFPAEARYDLNALTVTTDAELLGLAYAIASDICAVASALAKGSTGDTITIGPMTIKDGGQADPQLAALASLWCANAKRLSGQLAGKGTGKVRPMATIYAGAKQGANPCPVFYAPKLGGCAGDDTDLGHAIGYGRRTP